MAFLPYSVIFGFSAVLAFGLALYGWRHRHVPGAGAFSLFQILWVVWPLAQAVDVATADLGLKIFLMKIRFDPPVFAAVAFWVMAAQLTEQTHMVTRRRLAALCTIPVLGMILNWTGPNLLFRHSYYVDFQGPFPVLHWTNGPLYWGWFLYVLALYLSPLYLLRRSSRRLSPLSVQQSLIISIAVILPLMTNILFHFGITPLPGFNPVPAAQSLASVMMVWAIFHYHAFKVVPIARGLLISSMGDGVVVLDAQNRIVDINPSAHKMIGPTARSAFGVPAQDVFAPWPDLVARFHDTQEAQTEIAVEGNETYYLDLKIEPLRGRRGQSIGRVIVFRDITQRKKAEKELRESREWFRVTLTSIGDGVIAVDKDGRITFLNSVAAGLTGWQPEESQGQPFHKVFRIINEKTGQPAEDIVARVLRDRCVVMLSNNTALITREGREIPIEDSAAPILDASGNIIGTILVFHDVTEKRRTQEALKESENRLRRFYESGLLGVITWNMNGEITDANDKFLEMVGYDREDLKAGRIDWGRMTPPEYRHLDEQSVAELKATGINRKPFEKEYIGKDGSRIPVLVAGAMLDEVRFKGVAFVLDITERTQAEQALRASRLAALNLMEDAVEARRAAEQISAELEARVEKRTSELTNAIDRLQIEILKRQLLEDTLRESEKQIRFFASRCLSAQETERKRIAAELHDSIAASLAAIKYSIEKTQTEKEQGLTKAESLQGLVAMVQQTIVETRRIMTDLRPSVLDDLGLIAAMNWFCREYQKTYSHITVDCAIGLSESDLTDSLKTPIFRIVQEALNNIAKYSEASLVGLFLEKKGTKIQLTIRDNGHGFDLKEVVKGFGLSTMKERAEFSGGTFAIESGKRGTTIQVSWPLKQ